MPRHVAVVVGAICLGAGLLASRGEAQERAAEHYVLHCSGCHRSDGYGVPGTTPSLHTVGRLLAAEGGREYLAQVPGVAQAPLDDRSLARLLNWAIEAFSGEAPTPPYSAAEVGRLRASPLRDPRSVRPAIAPHAAVSSGSLGATATPAGIGP